MNLHTRRSTTLMVLTALFAVPVAVVRGQVPVLIASASAPSALTTVAEQPLAAPAEATPSSSSASELPDAPSEAVLRATVPEADQTAPVGSNPASKYEKSISPDETAQPLTGGDKVVLSLRQLYSPISLIGEVVSGGYTHLVNGSPNYGRNGTAAGKRIGAAVVRGSAQEIFADAIFCPMLHMDPRYYVQGPQHSFVHRAFYAATRVLVSKTDSGRTTVNAPLLLSYAGTAALDMAYYPQINRNVKDGVSDFGGSLGGAAIGFLFNEFADGLLRAVHLSSAK